MGAFRSQGLARLPPRCRLIFSSSCKWFEGFGCSPNKKVRELGSYRRKAGSPLSSDKIVELDCRPIVREDFGLEIYG